MVIFLILSILHLWADMNRFLFIHNWQLESLITSERCAEESIKTAFWRTNLDIFKKVLGDGYKERYMI